MNLNQSEFEKFESTNHFIRNAKRVGWPGIVSCLFLHLLRYFETPLPQEYIFVILELSVFIFSMLLDWQATKLNEVGTDEHFLRLNYFYRITLYFSLSAILSMHFYFYELKSWIGLAVIGILAGGLESISSSAFSKKNFAFVLLVVYGCLPTLVFYYKSSEIYSIPAYLFICYVLSQSIKINFRYKDLLEMIKSKQEVIFGHAQQEELLTKMNMIMSASRFGFFFEDLQSKKLVISDELLQITGLPELENGEEAEALFRSRIANESREYISSKIDQFYSGRLDTIDEVFRFEKSKNQFIWLKFFMMAETRDQDNKPIKVIGYHNDISTQKEMENKLFHSTKLESIGLMASGMAHEINNPLTIAALILNKLLKKETDDSMTGDLKKLELAVGRITKIIKSLKMFSRDDSKDPFELVLLTDLVSDAVFFAQSKLETHKVKLNIDLPENSYIKAQKISLSQVFINLIHNASDAIENLDEKWIRIEGKILKSENILRIKFIDSGLGLPEGVADKIMTPFFTTKEAGKGTGLGLSVCSGIIRDHNGQLYIDSKANHTTFVIDLPINN